MCWRKPYWQIQEHVWHTSYHIFFVKTNHISLWIYGGFLFVLVRSFWNFFYNHNEFSSILQIASLYGLWEDIFVGIDDSKELDISDRVKIVQSKSCLINSSSIFFFLFLIKTFNFRWRMGNVASHFWFLPQSVSTFLASFFFLHNFHVNVLHWLQPFTSTSGSLFSFIYIWLLIISKRMTFAI